MIECKALRFSLTSSTLNKFHTQLDNAARQLVSIDHEILLDGVNKLVKSIAMVTASSLLPRTICFGKRDSIFENYFSPKYQKLKNDFRDALVAAVYYDPITSTVSYMTTS